MLRIQTTNLFGLELYCERSVKSGTQTSHFFCYCFTIKHCPLELLGTWRYEQQLKSSEKAHQFISPANVRGENTNKADNTKCMQHKYCSYMPEDIKT